MELPLYDQEPIFRSRLSFLPLVRTWQGLINSGHTEAARVYSGLADRFCATPKLLHPIDNYELINTHKELIGEAMATIFSYTLLEQRQFHAISTPFSNQIIYASAAFREAFMEKDSDVLIPWDSQVTANIRKARIDLAYQLILKKLYGLDLAGGRSFICAYPNAEEGIHNYFELSWDPQFTDVFTTFRFPALEKELMLRCHHVNDLQQFEGLRTLLPLEEFIFDGIMLIRIRQVTQRESLRRLQQLLQEDPALEEQAAQKTFRQELGYLLGKENVETGFTSFINNGKGWFQAQPFSLLYRLSDDQSAQAIDWICSEL